MACHSKLLVAAVIVALAVCAGCHKPVDRKAKIGAYLDTQGVPSRVRTVVFIPITNETNYPAVANGMTSALMPVVQDKQLFHVQMLPPPESPAEDATIDGRRPFTLKELAKLRQMLRCDAILVGSVGQYQPYPRMQIALYLRLIDLHDGRVIWAVDHAWDATDQSTQRRIECYFEKRRGQGYDPLKWRLATVSPAAFQQFVAFEIGETLPSGSPNK